jgi:hypothetical protein
MIADIDNADRSLFTVLRDTPSLTVSEKLQLIGQVARLVATIHGDGSIHRSISAAAVMISEEGRCTLSEVESRVLLGGAEADNDLIPPDLRNLGPRELPAHAREIAAILQQSGVQFEPQRIDLYQLGTLLCRVIANISVDDYLRSPRAKGQIPPAVQTVIDAAVGLNSERRYDQVSDLARDVSQLATAAVSGDETPSPISPLSETPVETPVLNAKSGEETPAHSAIEAALPFTRLDHYRITSHIGRGGMGDVYKGFDESLRRVVAIKVLPPELARNTELVARFYAEASAIAMLVHTNIIQIYFIGEDGGHHFFAMQYVEGESLGTCCTASIG